YPPRSACPASASESAPTQNAGGVPVTTTARTRSSAARSARTQRYSACIRPVHALWRCGRWSHTVATPPSTSKRVAFSSTSSILPECRQDGLRPLPAADDEVWEPRVAVVVDDRRAVDAADVEAGGE